MSDFEFCCICVCMKLLKIGYVCFCALVCASLVLFAMHQIVCCLPKSVWSTDLLAVCHCLRLKDCACLIVCLRRCVFVVVCECLFVFHCWRMLCFGSTKYPACVIGWAPCTPCGWSRLQVSIRNGPDFEAGIRAWIAARILGSGTFGAT